MLATKFDSMISKIAAMFQWPHRPSPSGSLAQLPQLYADTNPARLDADGIP